VVKIKIPATKTGLKRSLQHFMKKNKLKDASLRITITRGEGAFTLIKVKAGKPSIVIAGRKFKGYPAVFYSDGICAEISAIRQNEHSPLSGIKSLSFLNYILARMHAQENGFNEAVLLNTRGFVAEAATSNIFLVKNKKIITPSLNNSILSGITRSQIIKAAKLLGLKVHERTVSVRELLSADEVFLTSSLAEVLPVVRIGRIQIGKGMPGTVTKLLHACYKKMI